MHTAQAQCYHNHILVKHCCGLSSCWVCVGEVAVSCDGVMQESCVMVGPGSRLQASPSSRSILRLPRPGPGYWVWGTSLGHADNGPWVIQQPDYVCIVILTLYDTLTRNTNEVFVIVIASLYLSSNIHFLSSPKNGHC